VSFISKGFVDLSYTLQASRTYQRTKHFFYSLLEDDSYPYKRYFDYVMMLLILSSVMLLIRQVKYPLPEYAVIYNDFIISFIFLIEYLLRLWVYSSISKELIHQYEKDEFLGLKFRPLKALSKALRIKWKYVSSVLEFCVFLFFFAPSRSLGIPRVYSSLQEF
jgi:voltage-gated potassium channel